MRTLIIDNYDSFTYNLFQMIAAANKETPVVIKNDESEWSLEQLAHFDNVVISPGPGHPGRESDFGICQQVIAHAKIPILGVCLGHQGIALGEGAEVDLAPEPRHGRLSKVTHLGVDILEGIPSPFSVVRYHSLSVRFLPSSVEAIGHAEDGVLMALRHLHRPIWGVQFHPESICTEYGAKILDNFAKLTAIWQKSGRCKRADRSHPTLFEGRCYAKQPVKLERSVSSERQHMPILSRKIAIDLSPERVFERLFGASAEAFWLDSSLCNTALGRFSFMGDACGPLARVATASVFEGTVTERTKEDTKVVHSGFFDWLSADLAKYEIEKPKLPFDFALGWVGYLGYELKVECGAERTHRSRYPDATMIFADRVVVFDHQENTIYLLALAPPKYRSDAEKWLSATTSILVEQHRPSKTVDCPEKIAFEGELKLRHQHAEYLKLVQRCKAEIVRGESYEICLTNEITASVDLDPWLAYRLLRKNNPVPFAAYLKFGQMSVLSGSPERFLRVSGNGLVESKPIKGTRPRGRDVLEDESLRSDLVACEKDQAENLMIVDLVRNDLGMCAEIGSVRVPKLFDIESYATVHQMVSTIQAQQSKDVSTVDIVRAAFPGGSMTGAPKIRTMQILDELERGPRGIYSGAIGYISLSGAADFNIVIRTIVAAPGEISFGIGGAITALSDAEDEFEETAVKATSLLRLLCTSFPGRVTCPKVKGRTTDHTAVISAANR